MICSPSRTLAGYAPHPREHIFDKPLVSGDVYKTEAYAGWQLEMRKT